jgi:hypothetical protein
MAFSLADSGRRDSAWRKELEVRSLFSEAEGMVHPMSESDVEFVKQVIETAYIEGIHGTQDEATVRSGFHPGFAMLVPDEDRTAFDKVSVDEWLVRLEGLKADNPKMWSAATTFIFRSVDVAGYAAMAKLDVWKGDTHFSTDYLLLYKLEGRWQIVSKVFSVPS